MGLASARLSYRHAVLGASRLSKGQAGRPKPLCWSGSRPSLQPRGVICFQLPPHPAPPREMGRGSVPPAPPRRGGGGGGSSGWLGQPQRTSFRQRHLPKMLPEEEEDPPSEGCGQKVPAS